MEDRGDIMKKNLKILLSTALVGTVSFAIALGTYADYAKKSTSTNNTVIATRFDIQPQGNTFAGKSFDIGKISPGSAAKEFQFSVVKNNDTIKTETPVMYSISVVPDQNDGAMFANQGVYASPIKFKLMRVVYGQYVEVIPDLLTGKFSMSDKSDTLKPADVENFKLVCTWNTASDEADGAYAGKTGKFNVVFQANQIVAKSFTSDVSATWDKDSFKWYGPNDRSQTIQYYKNADGLKVIELGNLDIDNTNPPYIPVPDYSAHMKNVVLTQKAAGSDKYIATGTATPWNNQEFTLTYREGFYPMAYFKHGTEPAIGQYEETNPYFNCTFHIEQDVLDWIK